MATFVPSGGSDDGGRGRRRGRRCALDRARSGAPTTSAAAVRPATVTTPRVRLSCAGHPRGLAGEQSRRRRRTAAQPTTATTVRTVRDMRGVRGMTRQRYRRSRRLRWQAPAPRSVQCGHGDQGEVGRGQGGCAARPGPSARWTRGCCRRRRSRWPSTASWSPSRPSATPRPTPATPCSRARRRSWPGPCGRSSATGWSTSSKPVVDYVPEFGTNGKEAITVEQVMLHTAGFPHAPLGPPQWATPAGPPRGASPGGGSTGSRARPTSTTPRRPTGCSSAIIENVTGADFRDVVEQRVTGAGRPAPGARPRPRSEQDGIATLVIVGEPASPEEIKAAFGVDVAARSPRSRPRRCWPSTTRAPARSACPAAAASCGPATWRSTTRRCCTTRARCGSPTSSPTSPSNVRNRLPERYTGIPANRSLGLILAGDDGYSHIRGLGRTVSPGSVRPQRRRRPAGVGRSRRPACRSATAPTASTCTSCASPAAAPPSAASRGACVQ